MPNKDSLSNLLPDTHRDVLSDSLLDNLVQPFLSKPESDFAIGFVGERDPSDKTSAYLKGVDTDHEINPLQPMLHIKHGEEDHIIDFNDIVNALKLEGIDTTDLTTYLSDTVYNLSFPIDIDKFCNFQSYYWTGYYTTATEWNKSNKPEYYVVATGGVSDWSKSNKWIHVDDIDVTMMDLSNCIQATRPIIEFARFMESQLNTASKNGIPCNVGTPGSISYVQKKTQFNQKPLFNLYRSNGQHAGIVSPILYFAESNVSPVDSEIGARIVIDDSNDFIMEHGLVDTDGSFLYYKNTSNQDPLKSVWAYSSVYEPSYATDVGTGIPNIIPKDQLNLWIGKGAWLTPAQMLNNLDHKLYKRIKYADLFTHFVSVIEAQDGLTGSPFGKNNFRKLTNVDLGLGGKIKEFNSPYDLLFGIIAQSDISITNIISFAKQQYEIFINSIKEWCNNYAIDEFISSSTLSISASLPDSLLQKFLSFNDRVGSIYGDTTSPIRNLIATLPYLKLVSAVEPSLILDEYTNLPMIRHHDGHMSLATRRSATFKKQLAQKKFQRSNELYTSGVITPNNPFDLGLPWKKTLWFNPDTLDLKVYDVVSDTFEPNQDLPGVTGQYAYNRSLNLLWISNGLTWLPESNLNAPWKDFRPEDITNAVILRVENILFQQTTIVEDPVEDSIPYTESTYAHAAAQYGARWDSLMEKQFIEYAAREKQDPYAHTYFNISDAFTWNYSSMPLNAGGGSMWYEIYQSLYGTVRPDLHVHTLFGITFNQTEAKITDLISNEDVCRLAAAQTVKWNGQDVVGLVNSDDAQFPGQLWYDETDSVLKQFKVLMYWDNSNIPSDGLFLFDSINNVVMKSLSGAWIVSSKAEAMQPVTANNITTFGKWSVVRAGLTFENKLINVPLSVDYFTGELLAPWTSPSLDSHIWALSSYTNPQQYQIRKSLSFGENGLVEYAWKKSIDYLYDRLIVLFKCNPMKFIVDTWGYQYKRVQDGMLIDLYREKKLNKSEYYLHGEALTDTRDLSNLISVSDTNSYKIDALVNAANKVKRFTMKCTVSGNTSSIFNVQYFELTELTQVQIDAGIMPEFELKQEFVYETNTTYTGHDVVFSIKESLQGYKVGDIFELNVDAQGNTTQQFSLGLGNNYDDVRLQIKIIDTYQNSAMCEFQIQHLVQPTPEQRSNGAIAEWKQKQQYTGHAYVGDIVTIQSLSFSIDMPRDGYYLDDTFIVSFNNQEQYINVEFVNATIYKLNGINQWYVNYARYTSKDLEISVNSQIFRNWNLRLGYKTGGLIETGNLKIKSDYFGLTNDNFDAIIKVNKGVRRSTMHALYIELIRLGSTVTKDGLLIPAGKGDDWTYKVSVLNNEDPWVLTYVPKYDGAKHTFNALEKSHCDVEWTCPLEFETDASLNRVVIAAGAPFTITGIQNLIDFIFAYSAKLKDDGWVFDDDYNVDVDQATGRKINWQLEVEKFIDQQWVGISVKNPIDGVVSKLSDIISPWIGMRVLNLFDDRIYSYENGSFNASDPYENMTVFNRMNADNYFYDGNSWSLISFGNYVASPFKRRATFKSPRGYVANFNKESSIDSKISTYATDVNGDHLVIDSTLRVVRNDDMTYVVGDVPMMYLGINIDEYEHVVLFDDYVNTKLIYDSFLGMMVARLHFTTEKQRAFNGRLNYGGHYLSNGSVQQNIEKSILSLTDAYDIQKLTEASVYTDKLRNSVGFVSSDYYSALEMSQKAELQMWRGIIRGKGSLNSIMSYINNKRFRDAKVDDLWIYKIAEYGDSRDFNYPEMKIQSTDITSKITKFQLDNSLDVNVQGDAITLQNSDESRWFNPEDKGSDLIFEPMLYGSSTIVIDALGPLVLDASVRKCDIFEIEIQESAYEGIIIPSGKHYGIVGLTVNSEPIPSDWSSESYPYAQLSDDGLSIEWGNTFDVINSSMIDIKDPLLIGKTITINGYIPSYKNYGPVKVIDYKNNVVINEIEYFDPARGQFTSNVSVNIDMMTDRDPANYSFKNKRKNLDKSSYRQWGESHVGKVWYDTTSADYLPYYDPSIFKTENERISHWGAMTDWSRPKVQQWVSSPVHPKDWTTYVEENSLTVGGIPSMKKTFVRDRIWSIRPVAWKQSTVAGSGVREFMTSGEAGLFIGNAANVGTSTVYLSERKLSDYDMTTGVRFAGAEMVDLNVDPHRDVTNIFGMAEIISDEFINVGSSNNPAEIGISSSVFSDIAVVASTNAETGIVVSSTVTVGADKFIKLTNINTGVSQMVKAEDTPDIVGGLIRYVFNDIGVTLTCKTMYSHSDEWVSDNTNAVVTTTVAQRIQFICDTFGNINNDIVIYSAANIKVLVPFVLNNAIINNMPAKLDNDPVSWVGWVQPTNDMLDADQLFPNNEWEPIIGNWTILDNVTATSMSTEIEKNYSNKLTTNDGVNISQWQSDWTIWRSLTDTVKSCWVTSLSSDTNLTNTLTWIGIDLTLIRSRISVFINGKQIFTEFAITKNNIIINTSLNIGDHIMVKVASYEPSDEEMAWDPVTNIKPKIMQQYSVDYDYTVKDVRDSDGRILTQRYFFWVEKLQYPADGKTLSVAAIANKLLHLDDPYIAIQNPIQKV